MLDVFKIGGKIELDGIDKAKNSIDSLVAKAGKVAKSIGKVVAAGTAAFSALTVAAMNKAGELEQNMGGSEAVFKEYAGNMQAIATDAYKNMGLSASDFLATANKMGALFQGVGFGIEESADISAKAMQRAADVASIMGIDVSTAMESIAGAAKGNFTMMDNLGVAINDTTLQMYALEKGIDKSTQSMTTQEKVALAMELFMERTTYATGNYAKENETLSGSLTTAKAALDNFLSGAGDAEALADAFVNAAEVIIAELDTLLPSLVTGIGQLVQKLAPKLPSLLSRLIPSTIEAMGGIVKALPPQIPGMIAELAPVLIQGAKDLGADMIEAIADTFPALDEAFEGLGIRLDSLLTMVGGLVLAFKGFRIVKSVTSAIGTLKAVFFGLNTVMAANPIGAIVTALGGFVAAVSLLSLSADDAVDPLNRLSEEEKNIRREAESAAETLQEMHRSFEEDAAAIEAETQRTKDLWAELQTLADESGNVDEANRSRANYILEELSEATGKELEMIDGTIQGYQELATSIETTIQLKQAEKLINAYEEQYEQAVNARAVAVENAMIAQEKLTEATKELTDAQDALNAFERENAEILADCGYSVTDLYMLNGALATEWDKLQGKVNECTASYDAHVSALDEANAAADEHYRTMSYYQEAEIAFAEGNYGRVIELLDAESTYRLEQAVKLGNMKDEERAQLKDKMDAAQQDYEHYLGRMQAGVDGYTKDELAKYKAHYDELRELWLEAEKDAESAGKNIGSGVANGMEEQSMLITTAARKIINNAMSAMREVAQIASPSKVTTQFGRYLVEGLAEGIDDSKYMAEDSAAHAMQLTTSSFAQNAAYTAAPVNAESYHDEIQALNQRLEAFSRELPEMLAEAFAAMQFKINNREFGRMVRAVE